ncbi:MAG: IclR family transcriptional regulator [Oscillospiraceae bacterium]|nr:IclR family transcriptional regulator [Oscillospiraceae bacterium]
MEKKVILSVSKAVQVMELLETAGGGLSLKELSERLGWAKSTAHGIVSTLAASGLVEQRQSDGRYILGLRLFELGCAAGAVWGVGTEGRLRLRALAKQAGETAFLAGWGMTDIVILDAAEIRDGIELSPPGTRMPLYCSAPGKVMLAALPPGEYRQMLRQLSLVRFTARTVASFEALDRDCDAVRRNGWCVEQEEMAHGRWTVAAPVCDADGTARLALGLAGAFSGDGRAPDLQRLGALTVRAARELTVAAER